MSDLLLRRAEREGATAPPGSPERQRFLCELHRTGVDPLPLVAGDRVRVVSYFASRNPSQFDGQGGVFKRFAHMSELEYSANPETVRKIEVRVKCDGRTGELLCSYIEPEGLS